MLPPPTPELAAEFDQPIGLGELVRVDTSVAVGADADLAGLGESSP